MMYVRIDSPCSRRGNTKWRSSGCVLFRSSTIKSPPCASTVFSKRSTADSRSARSSERSAPVTATPRCRSRSATSAAARSSSAPRLLAMRKHGGPAPVPVEDLGPAEKGYNLPDHGRIADDPMMPQPGGRDERGARPGFREGCAIAPTHFAIIPIVDDEERHPHAGGKRGDVEVLPDEVQPPLQAAAHRRHDRPVDPEHRCELRAIAVRVG